MTINLHYVIIRTNGCLLGIERTNVRLSLKTIKKRNCYRVTFERIKNCHLNFEEHVLYEIYESLDSNQFNKIEIARIKNDNIIEHMLLDIFN